MTKPFLIDGSLMQTLERRKAVTLRMAMTLMQHPEGLASEQEAKRVLRRFTYPFLDIEILAGEARMVAFQEIVAKEMSET
jgi:hypothetical protein